ncbi:hypothetical protein [Streptomyces mirabilis]|uniref:hypothetical protein n=1 Tax=Streptomyces mirabilis TaxID=68239 RepID=UPI00368A5075
MVEQVGQRRREGDFEVLRVCDRTGGDAAVLSPRSRHQPASRCLPNDPFFEPWMEAGPHKMTIEQDGTIVHDVR